MKNSTGRIWSAAAIWFLLLGFFVFAEAANAQTKKRSKKQTTTSTIPQPVPQTTEPVVVSSADQYTNQNQQIITGTYDTPTQMPTDTEVPAQPESFDEKLDRLNNRVKSLETTKPASYEEKQKRLLLNLDILTRAEQRVESLRKQLFELVEKENNIKTRLETIEIDIRPESIERETAFTGSLRPELVREARRKKLDTEKTNLTNLLTSMQTTRQNLEINVQKADQMVERLRAVLEKDIDDALNEKPKEQ